MNITYTIPGSAVGILCRILNFVPKAFVAGGCLRDAINGRPVNDIDVFVPASDSDAAGFAISSTHKLVKSIPEPYLTFNNDVQTVRYYEAEGVDNPINIIGVTDYTCTPEQQLARFDFGLCRVAFDGMRLWKDLSFDRDQKQKTFTLRSGQTETQHEYSLRRYERLSAKYVGWKLIHGPAATFGELF